MYNNIDINSIVTPFLNNVSDAPVFTEELLYPLVDQSKDTFVTDILFCIFCQYSATDSDVFTTYAEKFLQKEYEGEAVDFTEEYRGIYKINKAYGTDPYAVWIRRCKEIGIRPWLTFRMNDCHVNAFLKSTFQQLAKKNGWIIGEQYGYFGNCLDYKVPEVRETMLRYLEEQVMRYDVHGVELDFQRELYCFNYLEEDMDVCTGIMNDFVRSFKYIVKQAEEKFGHPIRIAVRLTRDIDQSLRFGFDARTWAKEGLVDMIVPSPRWSNVDTGIPFDVWKRELPGVEIPGCLETLLASGELGNAFMTAETARGLAAGHLAAGADGIYLYNFFGQWDYMENRDHAVQLTCGSMEEIYRHPVRCFIQKQDAATCPKPYINWEPLPLRLAAGESGSITIRTGTIPAEKRVTLLLGLDSGCICDLETAANGISANGFTASDMPEPKNAAPEGTRCFAAGIPVPEGMETVLRFTCKNAPVSICWVEHCII